MAITKISSFLADLNFVYSITAKKGANSPVRVTSSSWPRTIRVARKFKLGTGLGKINTIGVYAYDIPASDYQIADLYDGLKSPQGDAVRMTVIRAFHMVVTLDDPGDPDDPFVLVYPNGVYGWAHGGSGQRSPFYINGAEAEGSGVMVGGGDGFGVSNAVGFDVSSIHRHLTIVNQSTATRRVELFVAGEGTDL